MDRNRTEDLFMNHTAARLNRQKHVRLKARDFIFGRQILAAHINSVTTTSKKTAKTESAQHRVQYKLNLGRDKMQVERHWDSAVLARLI